MVNEIEMTEDITVYGRNVGEFKIRCPYCGGEMVVREVYYITPDIGKVVLVSHHCSKCGFRKNEILPIERKGHVRIYFRVETEKDLQTKIVRSPTARIEIPELGLELEPGIEAPMFITNIEGIIARFIETLERIIVLGEEREKAEEKMKSLKYVLLFPKGFTIVVDDPEGLSQIKTNDKGKLLIELIEGETEMGSDYG